MSTNLKQTISGQLMGKLQRAGYLLDGHLMFFGNALEANRRWNFRRKPIKPPVTR